jgi:hypothetical protein
MALLSTAIGYRRSYVQLRFRTLKRPLVVNILMFDFQCGISLVINYQLLTNI